MTKEEARRHYNIKDNDKVILLFGNLRPYKGLKFLLDAIRGSDYVLVVAGQQWDDTQYDFTNVRFRDFRGYIPYKDAEAFFKACDIVVCPYTHFDAQSGVGNIALSYGKPIVVTNVGSLPKLVPFDELVAEACNSQDLREKIDYAFNNLDLIAQESGGLKDDFNWDKTADNIMVIYGI